MSSFWNLANPQLRDLAVYAPGKPIEETARELDSNPADIIKLASNENPLGPSPRAVAALQESLKNTHLYPDGSGYYLRAALARHLDCAPGNIILGNGSNEIIEFVGHAFLNPRDEVIISEHAFVAYQLIAQLFGACVIETPSPDFRHHLDAMADAITASTRVIFVANPNNPTGTLIAQAEIDRFISRLPPNVIAVFDEAYFEFLDQPPDTLRYVGADRNVVVLRTFSKIHGLAGLRIGYGIAPEGLIDVLQKTRQPFNVSSPAQSAAVAALGDRAHQMETKRVVDSGRTYLEEQLGKMGVEFVPGAANFVMVNVGDGATMFEKLLARKIIVRPLTGYKLKEWIRISIGTMEQNRQCIAALKEVLSNTTAN